MLSVFTLESERNLCVSFSMTDSGLCIYQLVECLNFIFLYNSQMITFPIQSCPVFYSSCSTCTFKHFLNNELLSLLQLLLFEFITPALINGLSDRIFPQVSRTLLSILVDLNNAIHWMVSNCPLISKSFCICTNPMVTVLRTPIIIGITVTFIFHSFFSSLARGTYPSFYFSSNLVCGQLEQQSPQFGKFSFSFVDYHKIWSSGRD